MQKYLYRFPYTWPEEIAWCERNPDADMGETTSMCFVIANSDRQAIEWGDQVAEKFVQILFGRNAYSWKSLGSSGWIENDCEIVQWATDRQAIAIDASRTEEISEFAARLVQWENSIR